MAGRRESLKGLGWFKGNVFDWRKWLREKDGVFGVDEEVEAGGEGGLIARDNGGVLRVIRDSGRGVDKGSVNGGDGGEEIVAGDDGGDVRGSATVVEGSERSVDEGEGGGDDDCRGEGLATVVEGSGRSINEGEGGGDDDGMGEVLDEAASDGVKMVLDSGGGSGAVENKGNGLMMRDSDGGPKVVDDDDNLGIRVEVTIAGGDGEGGKVAEGGERELDSVDGEEIDDIDAT